MKQIKSGINSTLNLQQTYYIIPIDWSIFFRYNIYTLLISLGAILNFQWMTSFAERSYTWPKWLPKMKALLALILQCVHIKRNVFTLYQEEYFLYTMSLWACYRNFTAFVQRYSCIDDIEGKRQLIKLPKKCELKFWLNRGGLRQQTQA